MLRQISSPFASSSRLTLSALRAPAARAPLPEVARQGQASSGLGLGQVRFRSQLAPRRTKYRKAQKGRVAFPLGGSLKGTTLENTTYGIRLLASARLTAAQLTAAQTAIKRKIKPIKGAECFLRVFPDLPVCVKGNETRMGKGKGGFEYWACRVPVGRVVFEVGGGGIREEIAKQALRLAQVKLPVPSEFITSSAPPRLGSIADVTSLDPTDLLPSPTPSPVSPAAQRARADVASIQAGPAAALPPPALLLEMQANGEGRRGARAVLVQRERRRREGVEGLVGAMRGLEVGQGQGQTQEARV